ncbi:hypothetical protein I4U23_021825 [Adineta vaga]|nr:hypothetical protein I4U23_021825 [Adineta vaga]
MLAIALPVRSFKELPRIASSPKSPFDIRNCEYRSAISRYSDNINSRDLLIGPSDHTRPAELFLHEGTTSPENIRGEDDFLGSGLCERLIKLWNETQIRNQHEKVSRAGHLSRVSDGFRFSAKLHSWYPQLHVIKDRQNESRPLP